MWIFGCSGADPQDVLSNTVGTSTTTSSSGSSGTTTSSSSSGSSGTTTSSSSSGSSGTTTSSSSGGPNDPCTAETDDSNQDNPIKFDNCVSGTLTVPGDRQDYAEFEMPKNSGIHAAYTGPITVTYYAPDGKGYDISNLPNREGLYLVQIDLDVRNSGGNIGAALPWSITLTYK